MQRQFIASHVSRCPSQNGADGSRKCFTLIYTLPVDDSEVRVCKTFFLQKLDITSQMVRNTLDKISPAGILTPDRWKGRAGRKQSEVIKANMLEHIKKFPEIASRYCRREGSASNIWPKDLIYQKCTAYTNSTARSTELLT